jgi:hypothetical protein
MIAHRRSDVADLNERARALMAEEGRLGTEEVTTDARAFARGDRVLARRNDRRASIVNGARGLVLGVDTTRRSVTVQLQTDQTVVLESAYLDAGHLDHGYAVTAHAAQGATVDRAFVLGSDDLYREWGYTALTRHREEARFYLVSPGSTERALPGLEPEPDPILTNIDEMLGESRQKSLAIDLVDDSRRLDVDNGRGPHGRDRRREQQLEAAKAAAEEAGRRLDVLREEHAALSMFARRGRAELARQIEVNIKVEQRWHAEAAALRDAPAGPSCEVSPRDDTTPAVDEIRDLVASGRPGMLHARPEGLDGREEWASDAVATALDALETRDLSTLDPPAPELDFDVPELDFGP